MTETAKSVTGAGIGNGPRVLVAGIGNVLHGDDGFGVAVAQRLAQRPDLPPNVKVVETGIGGISLVQELFDGYDVLLMVDAVDRRGAPGQIFLLETQVQDLREWPQGLGDSALETGVWHFNPCSLGFRRVHIQT